MTENETQGWRHRGRALQGLPRWCHPRVTTGMAVSPGLPWKRKRNDAFENETTSQDEKTLKKQQRVCLALREIQVKHCLLVFLRRINSIILFLQWKTNCSTKTLEHVLSSLRNDQLGELVRSVKGKEMPKSVKQFDKKSQKMVSSLSRSVG